MTLQKVERTNRWDLVSFFHILDTVRVNIKTVWCLKNSLDIKKINAFKSTNKIFHRKSSNKWIRNSTYKQNGKIFRQAIS